MLIPCSYSTLELFLDESTDEFFASVASVARMVGKESSSILRAIKEQNWTTRREYTSPSAANFNRVHFLDTDQILDILEKYRSPKLLDFITILDQHQQLIAE